MKPANDTESYDTMRSDLESGECAVIQGHASKPDELWFCGTLIGQIGDGLDFETTEAVLAQLKEEMHRSQFWPNIYHVNERGSVSLLDSKGNELESWV